MSFFKGVDDPCGQAAASRVVSNPITLNLTSLTGAAAGITGWNLSPGQRPVLSGIARIGVSAMAPMPSSVQGQYRLALPRETMRLTVVSAS